MGRGAQAQTQQMIDQQLSQQNAMNQQLYSQSQALGSQAAAGYQNLLANPGYTPAEQSAITNLSQSALSSAFDALAQNASRGQRARETRPATATYRLARTHARTTAGQPRPAKPNRLCQRRELGHTFRALGTLRPVWDRRVVAWPHAGDSVAAARHQRAQRGEQRL